MAQISSHVAGLCYGKLGSRVGMESCHFSLQVAWCQRRLSVPELEKQQQDTDSKQKL